MQRRGLFLITTCLVTAGLTTVSPSSLRAAEVTDIADAADTVKIGGVERDDPFDLYLQPRFSMTMQNGKITREPINRTGLVGGCTENTSRDCLPVDELRYDRTTNIFDVTGQIGIFHDLAITFGWSYVLSDSLKFRYAQGVGPSNSTVDTDYDFNGDGTVDSDDDLFLHDFESKHKGSGPFSLGLWWGPLSDERDPSKPSWVLKFNWESPWTTKTYNPGGSQRPTNTNPGPVGDGIHRLTFGMAFSKRIGDFGLIGIDPAVNRRGFLDPYMQFEYTLPVVQRDLAIAANKSGPFAANVSHVARFHAGVEVVPYEDLKNSRKISIDLGLRTAFFSEGRNWSLLTDPLQEYTYTEQYFFVGGGLGFYAQAAEFIRIKAGVIVGHDTEHFLTNEDVGDDVNDDGEVNVVDVGGNPTGDTLNPYFCGNESSDVCTLKAQPSYDQVGFRFKDEEHVIFNWFVALELTL